MTKVSVCMISYNREKYISKAIEGILMQQSEYEIELIIGDDCSTDATRRICQEYKEKYPDKIKLLLNDTNIGLQRNYIKTLNECNGDYVAICDCDDYWTDPLKIQTQVKFLEENKDYVMCFHKVKWVDENDNFLPDRNAPKANTYNIKDLCAVNFIPNLSVVYRYKKIEIPEWYYDLAFPDWPMHIFLAQYGKIYFINNFMASYRLHSTNTRNAKGIEKRIQSVIECATFCNNYLNKKYNSSFRYAIYRNEFLLCKYHLNNKNYINGLRHLLYSFNSLLQSLPFVITKIFKKINHK